MQRSLALFVMTAQGACVTEPGDESLLDQSSELDPGTTGGTTVFAFDRNINNFPDWLADAFYEIDTRIRARTEAKVRDALAAPERHDALERALDEVITLVAKASIPGFTDFGSIDKITYYGGDLYVHYE